MDIHKRGHQQDRRTDKRRYGKKDSTKKSKDQPNGRRSTLSRKITDNDNSTPSLQQQQPRYLHEQLPQRNKEDLRGRITRL